MLHINDLTFRIGGRAILDSASVAVPTRHKVGVVGRNGSGKTTLLRLIAGELTPDDGRINVPRSTRVGQVKQEAPGGPERLIDFVLATDLERTHLLQEADSADEPTRIAEKQDTADVDRVMVGAAMTTENTHRSSPVRIALGSQC